jgi:rhodanese-related sulfurtransferase
MAIGVDVSRVTADEVRQRLERGEPIALVDVRNPKAWAESDSKLPGAIRVPLEELEQRVGEIPRDRAVITYCT